MMPKARTEEQFPLLLVLVNDQDGSHDKRRIFARGRFDGIASGATNIITEWPNYLNSCWLTALVFGVTLFVVSVMLTSCVTYQQHARLPRCTMDYYTVGNRTVHLVHTSTRPWRFNQLQELKRISAAFPNYQVHVLVVGDGNTTTNLSLLENQNVLVTRLSFENVFDSSPIDYRVLSDEMRVFAVRVLQLWHFGGVSFDLLEFAGRKCNNCSGFPDLKLRKLISKGRQGYERLGEKEVSVDRDGLHMESKTPCHAFFGKLLMKIRKKGEATPRSVLRGPIHTFCKAGVVVKEFCHTKHVPIKFY